MKKGDCFLCSETNCRTLYYIVDVATDKLDALHIYIGQDMVQGLECPSEYDDDIPEDIVMMPSSMYDTIKKLMRKYVKKIHSVLIKEQLEEDFEIMSGGNYTDGSYIYTMTMFDGNRWLYQLFRVEDENISPYWTGEATAETLKCLLRPISDGTMAKVQRLYEKLREEISSLLDKS